MPTQERAEEIGIVLGATVVKPEWRMTGPRRWELYQNRVTLSAGDRRWPTPRFVEHDEELLAA
jgi:hypothetical protein